MDVWSIVASVVVDIQRLEHGKILVAEIAAFEQEELGRLASACVNRLQAGGLAFMRASGGEHFIEPCSAMDEGKASALAQAVGGEGEEIVEGKGVLMTREIGLAVRIGGAVSNLEKRRIAGDEIVATGAFYLLDAR